MRLIPIRTKTAYEALLAKQKIPKTSHFSYLKWLRFYLDFCLKYNFKESNRKSLTHFINKLQEKKQTDHQQKQAFHAVSLFYEIELSNSDWKNRLNNKNKIFSTKKNDLKLTNADWRPVYDNLNSEIKIRHYSPKILKAYRGWVRHFQNFTKSKDPQSLTDSDVKEFLTYLAVERKVSASIYTHTIKSQTIKEAKSPLDF